MDIHKMHAAKVEESL